MAGLLITLPLTAGCSATGGTETATTDSVGLYVQQTASALVPLIDTSEATGLNAALTYGSSSDWDVYLLGDNIVYLEEIFGDPNSGFSVVTKTRVLLNQLENTIEGITTSDPTFICEDAVVKDFGATLDVAFYGSISNGAENDRYFDCLSQDGGTTTIYGQDATGTIRVVQMQDSTETNTESPEIRGDEVTIKSSVITAFHEETIVDEVNASIDLQYVQATIYNGADGNVNAQGDNVLFKSRSRITGKVTIDALGNVTSGAGQFAVTKYDQSPTDGSPVIATTETLGRGNPGTGAFLFKINSTSGTMNTVPGTFCVQSSTSVTGTPTLIDSSNCTAYETSVPWDTADFPFTLSPVIANTFENETVFDGNSTTEMITNTGSNFTIPTY